MTKLTPIQELADKHCSETRVFKGEYSHEFTVPQLESLRQAIISDFVSNIEPYGWVNRNTEYEDYVSDVVKNIEKHPNHSFYQKWLTIPLFDLSEWKR